jgi:hypothetical protein
MSYSITKVSFTYQFHLGVCKTQLGSSNESLSKFIIQKEITCLQALIRTMELKCKTCLKIMSNHAIFSKGVEVWPMINFNNL